MFQSSSKKLATKMDDPIPTHLHDHRTTFDTRLSESNQNCISSPSGSDEVILQFRTDKNSDDSGVVSPPLWKNSPSPSHPLLSHQHHCLSPGSRRKAIANGQRELMEMVKNMPESSYELSLKDLVEHRDAEISRNNGKNQILQKRAVFVKVKSKKNGSFEDKGLFLKMGFLPFILQSKRFGDSSKKGSEKVNKISSEKKFTGCSGRSSSSRQRKKHGFPTAPSCCPFFNSKTATKSPE